MRPTTLIVLAVTALFTLGLASDATAGPGHGLSLEKAMHKAEKTGQPILLKVGTEWCKSCKSFDSAVESNAEFRDAIAQGALLVPVDAEKGEGVEIAQRYQVGAYPTFILANASGETMDRWMGFEKKHGSEKFLKAMNKALADPMTVTARLERFRDNPTEKDARKLGDLRQYEGYSAEAVAYYRRAAQLAPESDTDYELRIFGAMARGAYSNLYGLEEVRESADAVFANADATPEAMFDVYYTSRKIEKKHNAADFSVAYLKQTVERTEGASDERTVMRRTHLLPSYALKVEKDAEKALAYRRATLPEGWKDDANQLNSFAWWCFEANVNLAEAEQLARRGVELAEPGTEKANVLDTLAELCNLNDDCAMAVEYIRLAIAEDPESDYFRKQLVRFQEILAVSE